MSANFSAFARALDRAAADLPSQAVLRAKQKLARRALADIVARTPVASGQARANWQVGVGSPALGVVDATDPSGGETLARGVAAIMADRAPFATVWITNNLPYVQQLERGTSRRAPAGMIAVTLAVLGQTKRARSRKG